MPTYDYRCRACEHTFERFQSITAKPVRRCPECGKNQVERLISGGAGLIFKGSGFYITDYRSEGYKQSAKGESTTSAPAGGDAKGDSAKSAEPAASPSASAPSGAAATKTGPSKPAAGSAGK